MIGRGDVKLSDLDILTAAETMKNHLALLNKDQTAPSEAEVLASSLRKVVQNGSGEKLSVIDKRVEQIHNNVC